MTIERKFRVSNPTCVLICFGVLASIFHPIQRASAEEPIQPPPSLVPVLTWTILRGGVPVGGVTTLQFIVTNPSNITLNHVQISDELPQPLIIASPHNFQSTCSGTAVAAPGTDSITLSIPSLAASSSCTLSVDLAVAPGGTVDIAVSNTATPSAANGAVGLAIKHDINVTTPVASCAADTHYSSDRHSLHTYANPQPTSGQFALATIFNRPVISRGYEGDLNATLNVSTTDYGTNLQSMHPSYISSLIYLNPKDYVSVTMQAAWYAMREANPGVPLDVEISLNPGASVPFTRATDATAFMATIQCQLQPDVWFFDFYSTAAESAGQTPDETTWLTPIINYAHGQNQLVGGNYFDEKAPVPTGTDFVAFVDDSTNNNAPYGYGYKTGRIDWLNNQTPKVFVLGHLQSNPQNELLPGGSESCQYMSVPGAVMGSYDWTEPNQISYLDYWAAGQKQYNFRFMYPAYYPVCPAGVAYDPTTVSDPNTSGTLFTDMIHNVMNMYNQTN